MKIDEDDFALLGLPRRFELDADMLAAQWRALQSRVHPDRFASEGAAAQRLAMQWAVRVNEAHQRLRDPLTRAAYLCGLAGHPMQSEATAMPQEVLQRQMRWHESLAEAASPATVRALDAEVAARVAAVGQAVAEDLDVRHDAAAALPRLREWMFLARFRAEVERRLEALEAERGASECAGDSGTHEGSRVGKPAGF
jgi:molecular chaperone HscB